MDKLAIEVRASDAYRFRSYPGVWTMIHLVTQKYIHTFRGKVAVYNHVWEVDIRSAKATVGLRVRGTETAL